MVEEKEDEEEEEDDDENISFEMVHLLFYIV
jgi:hypothetical protein